MMLCFVAADAAQYVLSRVPSEHVRVKPNEQRGAFYGPRLTTTQVEAL